jgi:hypothetical protein
MSDSGFDQVYDELVRAHGLASATDLLLAKLLAEEMLRPEPSVDVVLRLRAALPAPKAVADDKPDPRLASLSAVELELLGGLLHRLDGRRYRDAGGADPTVFAPRGSRDLDAPDENGLYRPDELAFLLWRDERSAAQIESLESRIGELARANDELAAARMPRPAPTEPERGDEPPPVRDRGRHPNISRPARRP